MKFENPFSGSGRESHKRAFIPLEEFPDNGPTPEDLLMQEEDADEEDAETAEEVEDEDAGVPPPHGETQYDRLIALAHDERNVLDAEHPLADEVQATMDAKGLRPSHRDRRDQAADYDYRPAHGFRGKEHPDKHQKGGEKTQ